MKKEALKNKQIAVTASFKSTVPSGVDLDIIHAYAENYFATGANLDIELSSGQMHLEFDSVTAEEKPSKKKETKRVGYNQKQAEKLLKRIENELAKYPGEKWAQETSCIIARVSRDLQGYSKNDAADSTEEP